MRGAWRRIAIPTALLIVVMIGAAGWYWLVESFTPLNALFQSVTTITTVGFEEVEPLDRSGKIFTIVYVLGGVGLMFYTASAAVELLVVGGVVDAIDARQGTRRIRRMAEHTVICGFGRVGREVAHELSVRGTEFVVVDSDAERVELARSAGYGVVHGDATEEQTLLNARVREAKTLIAALDSDTGNTYIVLTARALSPLLNIVARAGTDSAERRLLSAGATRVISLYRLGGRRMALMAEQPMMLELFDWLVTQRDSEAGVLAEVLIGPAAACTGQTLAEAFAESASVRVLGIVRASGEFVVGPAGPTRIEEGDRLVLYGEQPEIERFSAASGEPARG